MSEVSESPDVGDVQYIQDASRPLTREDATLARIDALKDLLNEHPLVPRDPRNPSEPFLDMASGVRLPDVHCAFRGCRWCKDINCAKPSMGPFWQWQVEWRLFKHLMKKHADAFEPELQACNMSARPKQVPTNLKDFEPFQYHTAQSKWQCDLFLQVYSVYMAAVCERERESMPVIGIAKDRQVLRGLNAVLPEVKSMMCFGCAQIRTHVPVAADVRPGTDRLA